MRFAITTLGIKGLFVTLSITTPCHCAEYHIFNVMLNISMLEGRYAECRYAGCRGA
jgi:hypothetical protein